MTREDLMDAAIAIAQRGLDSGEMPIGAVVAVGDEIIAQAHTQDRGQGRRLVHADLLAMTDADHQLGWRPRTEPLRLAVNLEPCLMCCGAAMALKVDEISYGLESPADGATALTATWPASADLPWYTPPTIHGGIRRAAVREQFRVYAATAPDSGFRRWAHTLARLPD